MLKFVNKIISFAGFVFLSSIALAETAPSDVIQKAYGDVTTAINKDPTLLSDKNKSVAFVQENAIKYFNFQIMSKSVLGKNYKSMNDEQRVKFENAFKQLLVKIWSKALRDYKGETLTVKSEKPTESAVKVATLIKSPGGKEIAVDYVLAKNDQGIWLITDIVIEGVSMVMNYRGQINNAINQKSIDVIIQDFENKSIA